MVSYKWRLADANFTKDKGKVFSCFACGGGSTMGYKLAGFDVIGCNEIDPRMMEVYIANHHPKYSFLEGIQTFKDRTDLPDELYNLDILDGSPPCLAGSSIIITDNGLKAIQDVNVGDFVLSLGGYKKVTEFFERGEKETWRAKIVFDTPGVFVDIEATPDHRFLTRGGWKPLCELVENDELMIGSDKWDKVKNITHTDSRCQVFDIGVEDTHCFFANGVMVHNCSSFSMAGARDKGWGKEKKFREGQANQVLDTLFFDYIDLAKKLQPKVIVAENVKGILLGDAVKYCQKIIEGFEDAGYYVKYYLLNASKMGVPQARERVFFICLRRDLAGPVLDQETLFEPTPVLTMDFNEPIVPVGEFADFLGDEVNSPKMRELWEARKWGDGSQSDACWRIYKKKSNFGQSYIYLDKPSPTLTAHKDCLIHFAQPRYTSRSECCCISTFPQDYNFGKEQPWYICGMSVPCLMCMHVAQNIYDQWLSKI